MNTEKGSGLLAVPNLFMCSYVSATDIEPSPCASRDMIGEYHESIMDDGEMTFVAYTPSRERRKYKDRGSLAFPLSFICGVRVPNVFLTINYSSFRIEILNSIPIASEIPRKAHTVFRRSIHSFPTAVRPCV